MAPDFSGRRYVPPRRIARNEPGRTIPNHVAEWAVLYEGGWTIERIALDTGWRPNTRRNRQRIGAFSPTTVRSALKDWGISLRRPGGRGSSGRSILVRVADLERRMAEMERARSW